MNVSIRSSVQALAIAALMSPGCGLNTPSNTPAPVPESAVPVVKAVPKPAGTVAERIEKAKKSLDGGDPEAAIVVLDEAVLIDPVNREVLAMLVKAYLAGAEKAEASDPAKSYRYNVTCGGYMRELRDKFQNLTAEEKALIVACLRSEAAAHAKSKRVEETTGSLRELKGAGFADFESLRQDPDFAAIFEVEAFRNAFDEMVAEK
jgi:hypothetical protein